MKVRMYQSLRAVALALVLGALFAPSALADPPSGLDPWAYRAVHQHQVQNTVPLSENTIGLRNERTISASLGGLDPWGPQRIASGSSGEQRSGQREHDRTKGQDELLDRTHGRTGACRADNSGRLHWSNAAIGASFAALLGLLSFGGTVARRRRASLAH